MIGDQYRQAAQRRRSWRPSPAAESFNRYRERRRWRAMIERCEKPSSVSYGSYGARGIKVCERWHDFECYYADIMAALGPCPLNESLDRICNDGDYEPGNVRWASADEQAANRRPKQQRVAS